MFDKILIANRGEIAVRVARTCKRLGIRTVAVYSEADAGALHVSVCDEAHLIGPAAAQGELSARGPHPGGRAGARARRRSIRATASCRRTRTSPRPASAAGIVFIGPPASAIRAMGSKSAAKQLMEKAGVPLVPGYHGEAQDLDTLAREAERIGYPVLIKASAGGGGKGMRIVESAAQLEGALASAKREAASSFGDDRVLIEKYLTRPRHIEMQVFADTHGNAIHLFERDCSVQRRHQKVLEEAPAPGHDRGQAPPDGLGRGGRRARGRLRERRHRGVHRRRARRVLLHGDEHPAAGRAPGDRDDHRARPGRVAAARGLRARRCRSRRSSLRINGHAIEARIYAEDPARDFLPAAGRIAAPARRRRAPRMCASTPACARATRSACTTTR